MEFYFHPHINHVHIFYINHARGSEHKCTYKLMSLSELNCMIAEPVRE